ncbi:MAG: GNAT family N-acetyltransferase [Rhizobiales bacterium]|nr:GNAT family N-acetyltransferase [Hyphomicrobiales bacterium]
MSEHRHPQTGQPVGPPVDDRPAIRPGPVTLQGRFGRIEKLAPAHAEALWQAVKDHDSLWTYSPSSGPFADAASFTALIATRAGQNDPYFYAIVDARGRALGVLALMAIRPEHRVVEVGHVVYSPALQRTPLATEAQYLLARYAIETLGYRRYEWKCDALNAASRRAALRLGFTFESIMRQHMIAKGRNRDTAWYSILDSEWRARQRNFERWLAPDNFAADGRQIASLSALNGVAE